MVQLTRMLPGATRQLSDSREYPIVHGQLVSGQPLSLLNATGIAGPGAPDWVQTLYPESTIEGGFLSSVDEPFYGALIELPHLVEWLGSFVGQRGDLSPPFAAVQKRVTIKVPQIGDVIFAETKQVKVDARGRSESKDAGIFIQLEQPTPKEQVDEIVRAIQDMVTFFSGVANPLVRYELLRPREEVPPAWRVLEWSEYSKPDFTAPAHHWSEMVLRAEDERFNPDKMVAKWFEIHRDAASSLNQILAFTYVPAPFVDVHFLALVYGLEGLHRKFEAAPTQLTSTVRTRVEQATVKLSSRTRAYLKNLLDRAAEPTLEQRLVALAAVAGPSMAPLLATFADFAPRIARARNVMAHQLNKQSPISSPELPDVVELLRFLAEAYLLRKLGLNDGEVQWIFFNRPDYSRFVSYRGGSLIPPQR